MLEARERPGGRNSTARGGTTETSLDGVTQTCSFDEGQYMNVGPARIPQHHTTLEYCRELGVPIEVFTNANADGYYFNEPSSTGRRGAGRHRGAAPQGQGRHSGYVWELLAKAVNQGALDADLSASDKESAHLVPAQLRGAQHQQPVQGGRTGYPASDEPAAGFQAAPPSPPPRVSDVLASRLGNYFSFELSWDQAMLMYQPVGGMDRIPYAFEAALTAQADLRRRDHRHRQHGGRGHGHVHQAGQDAHRHGRPVHLHDPAADPRRTSPTTSASRSTRTWPCPRSTPTGKIGLQYGRRWWEEDEQLFGGITNTNMDLGTIWYPSYGYLGQKGVVVGYYNFGASSDAYGALSPADREARALSQGAKIHGQAYVDELENSFSNDWRKTRYSEGGWVGWPSGTRGGPDTAYGRLLQPSGNVYFAGDHLSHVIAWQHGALESARLTVTNLHDRVLAS